MENHSAMSPVAYLCESVGRSHGTRISGPSFCRNSSLVKPGTLAVSQVFSKYLTNNRATNFHLKFIQDMQFKLAQIQALHSVLGMQLNQQPTNITYVF